MSLTDTPNANRLHIALFGRRNSGKSSLINALTGQDTALVSDTPGTTTDPVAKAMEIHGIGPCLFIDTPGFDDEGELGRMRIERMESGRENRYGYLILWRRYVCRAFKGDKGARFYRRTLLAGTVKG